MELFLILGVLILLYFLTPFGKLMGCLLNIFGMLLLILFLLLLLGAM